MVVQIERVKRYFERFILSCPGSFSIRGLVELSHLYGKHHKCAHELNSLHGRYPQRLALAISIKVPIV